MLAGVWVQTWQMSYARSKGRALTAIYAPVGADARALRKLAHARLAETGKA